MKRGSGLKIGVIGAGVMGQHHIRILASLPGVRLSGVADPDLPAAEKIAGQFGVKVFADYQALLPEVEAVCLVTPTSTHFKIAEDCLAAGKHLLVEKPFTGSSATARSLISRAKEKKVLLAAGMIERYNPAFQKLRKELKGEKIIGIDIKRFSPFPERVSDTDVVFDMMLHDFDLLHLLMPDEIEDIRAKGEKIRTKRFDRVIATLTHKTGTISRLEGSRVFGFKTRKIAITTERGVLEADLLNKTVYLRDFSSPMPSALPVKQVDQLTEELKDFVAAIKGKQPLPIPGEEGLRALMLAEEVEKICS